MQITQVLVKMKHMAKKEQNLLAGGRNLQEAVAEIKQRFGEGSIMKLKDVGVVDIDAISTSSISLDSILGIGGIPRGRVVEIYGPESSGKTTVALHIASDKEYLGTRESIIIDKGLLGRIFSDCGDYKKFVKTTLVNKSYKKIDYFVSNLV